MSSGGERAGQPGRALRALVAAACVVILFAGLKASGDILLPVIFSVFLSILAAPGVRALQRIGVPVPLAILLVVAAVAGVLLTFTAVIAGTVRTFTARLPEYEQPMQQLVTQVLAELQRLGIAEDVSDLRSMLQPSQIMALVGQTLNATVGILSRLVIVTLTMTFILFEQSELAKKTAVAFGTGTRLDGPFANAPADVQRYLFIKTCVSLVTGVLVGAWCYLLGLDFALMWGLLAFLLNYIPTIGSILAAIPPILLALVQLGFLPAVGIAVGYIVVNICLGNLLEPRLLGRSLGLSPLVVFLSLLFWGWLWGPAGMLICVPMTVIAKLVLESHDDTRWIAVLLGSARDLQSIEGDPPQPQPAAATAQESV